MLLFLLEQQGVNETDLGEFKQNDVIFMDVEDERLTFKRLPAEMVTA